MRIVSQRDNEEGTLRQRLKTNLKRSTRWVAGVGRCGELGKVSQVMRLPEKWSAQWERWHQDRSSITKRVDPEC